MAVDSNMHKDVTGFILAGGKSTRLGRDKRLIRIAGKTLLERTAELFRHIVSQEPIIVADSLPELQFSTTNVIPDAVSNSGPLGGLVAALEFCRTPWALVLAVDLPFVQECDLIKLLRLRSRRFDVVALATRDGRAEPLIAAYSRESARFWRERLDHQELNISRGISQLRTRIVEPVSGRLASMNINKPADLEQLGLK